MSETTWINRGSVSCKGDTLTVRSADGLTLRTTCNRCDLERIDPVSAQSPREATQ